MLRSCYNQETTSHTLQVNQFVQLGFSPSLPRQTPNSPAPRPTQSRLWVLFWWFILYVPIKESFIFLPLLLDSGDRIDLRFILSLELVFIGQLKLAPDRSSLTTSAQVKRVQGDWYGAEHVGTRQETQNDYSR